MEDRSIADRAEGLPLEDPPAAPSRASALRVMQSYRTIWRQLRGYGKLLRDRSRGESPEMESAKSLCRLLDGRYQAGWTVLDAGCGAGHYLRSLRRRLDSGVRYSGLDATLAFARHARSSFPATPFSVGDVLQLPFADRSFDLVFCCNLLLHLPPPPTTALAELARVARRLLVVRTAIGRRNYLIQEVREASEAHGAPAEVTELIAEDGAPRVFNYFNLYSGEYLVRVLSQVAPGLQVSLIADRWFEPFDNRSATTRTGTRTAGGSQRSGNLMLDWGYLVGERDSRIDESP